MWQRGFEGALSRPGLRRRPAAGRLVSDRRKSGNIEFNPHVARISDYLPNLMLRERLCNARLGSFAAPGFPHVRIITNAANQFGNWLSEEFDAVGIEFRKP